MRKIRVSCVDAQFDFRSVAPDELGQCWEKRIAAGFLFGNTDLFLSPPMLSNIDIIVEVH